MWRGFPGAETRWYTDAKGVDKKNVEERKTGIKR